MKPQLLSLAFSLAAISEVTIAHGTTRPTRHPRDNSALLKLHKSLCDIPSVTPSETSISDWLATYLESHSFTVERQPVGSTPGRNNIYAYSGTTRKTTTLLTSHIDTVTPYIPYTRHSNGTITGRGTNDAKGSVAAQIIALEELLAASVIGDNDVSLLYVVGEEVDGAGMRAANDLGLSWDAVIFGEPTENKLSLGHKGSLSFTLEAYGKAAHSGYPQLGVDANRRLIEALYTLGGLEFPGSELLGNTTLNYGLMRGGVAANVVSAFANASIAVRLAVNGESVREVIDKALEGMPVRHVYSENEYGPQLLDHDVEGEQVSCPSLSFNG